METKQRICGSPFPGQAAFVACNGSCQGNERQRTGLSGEGHICRYGCNGCERCMQVCPAGAIRPGAQGVARVNEAVCTGCGRCISACPRELIHLHERGAYIVVSCSNRDKGRAAMEVCPSSCTGCGLCEKICTAGAITLRGHCAVIDETICLSCGMCAVKCPRHAITDLRGILTDI